MALSHGLPDSRFPVSRRVGTKTPWFTLWVFPPLFLPLFRGQHSAPPDVCFTSLVVPDSLAVAPPVGDAFFRDTRPPCCCRRPPCHHHACCARPRVVVTGPMSPKCWRIMCVTPVSPNRCPAANATENRCAAHCAPHWVQSLVVLTRRCCGRAHDAPPRIGMHIVFSHITDPLLDLISRQQVSPIEKSMRSEGLDSLQFRGGRRIAFSWLGLVSLFAQDKERPLTMPLKKLSRARPLGTRVRLSRTSRWLDEQVLSVLTP